jgi:hypothetical protein
MSIISASTLTTTALQLTADTAGTLVFRTGATPTTALTLNADQSATFAGTVNFGTAGFTNLSVTGVATFALGSVSAPSITFTGDTNTGIYSPAADTIAFTEGGAEAMRIDSSGNVLVGTATAQELLTVNKNAAFGTTADAFSEIRFFNSTATSGTTRVRATAGDLTFLTSNAERMRIDSSGNVCIGTTTGVQPLTIGGSGNIYATGGATWYTGGHLYIRAGTSGNLRFGANNANDLLTLNTTGTLILNGANTSANGTGITFPATQSASSDANTLDDYEEGTWTPTDASGASLSFSGATGTYTKIGKFVYAACSLTYPSTASGSSALIGSLPFTVNSSNNGIAGVSYTTYGTAMTNYVGTGSTALNLAVFGGTLVTNANMSGKRIDLAIVYQSAN